MGSSDDGSASRDNSSGARHGMQRARHREENRTVCTQLHDSLVANNISAVRRASELEHRGCGTTEIAHGTTVSIEVPVFHRHQM